MFGMKLKSWMEAHLGRPRNKDKSSQKRKESSGASTSQAVCVVSSSNSSSSSTSNSNTTIVAVTSSGGESNNLSNDTENSVLPPDHEKNFCSPLSNSGAGVESVTVLQTTVEEGVKNGGGGGAKAEPNGEIVPHVQNKNVHASSNSSNITTRPSVTTSVSNSTSILSGSSFSNSLSSPDTGYSTDGYSPKSVYPALSFEATGNSKSTASTSSKSSYTISSLASSELLAQKQSSSALSSCSSAGLAGGIASVLKEFSPSSPAALTSNVFSQSCSSGISTNDNCFPRGLQVHHNTPFENKDVNDEKQQVIMGRDEEVDGGQNKASVQVRSLQAQKLSTSSKTDITTTTSTGAGTLADSLSFSPFDFKNPPSKHNAGRTHRRAESMDARTPSHEDYKPLVENDEDNEGGGNPSLVMTGQPKNIRTSFVIDTSGHIVEFSSYKNAYSICSPRRERTRIKTNPWIIINNKMEKESNGQTSDKEVNPQSNSEEGPQKKVELKSCSNLNCSTSTSPPRKAGVIPLENRISMNSIETAGRNVNIEETNHHKVDSKINKIEEGKVVEDGHFVEEYETGIIDHSPSSSSLHFRISTSASASDSGKGTLDEEGTNRNSTESSCLFLSDSTTAASSTRNSIISHETRSGTRSGRSSSGESISSSHPPVDNEDTLGHSSPTSCSDPRARQKEQRQHIHQVSPKEDTMTADSIQGEGSEVGKKGKETRTFKNAAVATDLEISPKFHKSSSVSVGVGTTGSTGKAGKFPIVMVDKETDILSDWANTDEDGDEEMETDRNDNETVTPVPSSPDVEDDRALFSQSTSQSHSSATDIDFGDSSAATQASSTAVFPPSSLLSQHRNRNNNRFRSSNNNKSNDGGESGSGGNGENGARFHNNEANGFSNGGCGNAISTSEMVPGSYPNHYQHNINMNLPETCYPPSVPIIRPVLANIPDAYNNVTANNTGIFVNHGGDLVNHFNTFHPHAGTDLAAICYAEGGSPNFNLRLGGVEGDYPEIKQNKGIARGALGFLRKMFKKGACSSQRHSPDSIKGKKCKGKSDNNLSSLGLGSPLLTISEPLSNPRYSAVLTSKKQMNPTLNSYFFTPTPNSFRRRSGGGGTGTDSSDSKSSKNNHGKTVKTDIIRLPPQGTLSPQQSLLQQQQRGTSSSHSSAGSTCSSGNGGIPTQTCSTFFPNFPHQMSSNEQGMCLSQTSGAAVGNIFNLPSQSNSNTNSTSGSSSIQSLMSTSTSAASTGNVINRPPSQCKTSIPPKESASYYANSSSPTPRQSGFLLNNNGNCSNNGARGNSRSNPSPPPPPLISGTSPYLNGVPQSSSRRELHSHVQSPSLNRLTSFDSPRLPSNSNASAAAAAKMNSPSFNNYSPIHRLVVTGGTHLIKPNPTNCPNASNSSMESQIPRYSNGNNNSGVGNVNPGFTPTSRPHHHHTTSSPSPLINHRHSTTSSSPHPFHPNASSSQQPPQHPGHFFASPSPILRNPRYQYITSSNQNSPVLNTSKRMNAGAHPSSHNGNPNGPPPLLTTFAPIPSASSSSASVLSPPRESLINNNSFHTNTITSANLNSDPFNQRTSRQVVSSSLSYNEFENLTRQQQQQSFYQNNGNENSFSSHSPFIPQPQTHHQNHLLHQSHKGKIHHQLPHHNHYYSSPIVKGAHPSSLKQSWNNVGESCSNNNFGRQYKQQQRMNQNLRFNSFLVRHRQLPHVYHTQWGLQERIYETVDSEGEQTASDEMSGGGGDYDQDQDGGNGNEVDRSELSLPVHSRNLMKQSYSHGENFGFGGQSRENALQSTNLMGYGNQVDCEPDTQQISATKPKSKRSKPKSLSASGRPLPRPVVALPMMPGTFLSPTETRLLEVDESDRKYKRLINEAEALLKEISVEKSKRSGATHDNNRFRLEDCPQSDPLRRKAYDCWALRRLQQELAGCCASPPVLHRSRLNLQSPSTPVGNNPYLSHFQNKSPLLPLPQQVPYMSSAMDSGVDNNLNNFEF